MFNVGFTSLLALAHTFYISRHERMSVIDVLESKSEYVTFSPPSFLLGILHSCLRP